MDPVQELLSKMEHDIAERRLSRVVVHIKRGRYAIFACSLFLVIPTLIMLINNAIGTRVFWSNMAGGLFFLLLFFWSGIKPYPAFLIATFGYVVMYLFLLLVNYSNYSLYTELLPALSPVIMIIAILLRLVLLFFLINGIVYARKYKHLL